MQQNTSRTQSMLLIQMHRMFLPDLLSQSSKEKDQFRDRVENGRIILNQISSLYTAPRSAFGSFHLIPIPNVACVYFQFQFLKSAHFRLLLITVTHRPVFPIMVFIALFGNGCQQQTFLFLEVPELSSTSATATLNWLTACRLSLDSDWFLLYSLGKDRTENTASNTYSVIVCYTAVA